MGSSPISGRLAFGFCSGLCVRAPYREDREPQSISFSLLASFLAKRAPCREPDSAQPLRFFLSLLPRRLEPHASGTPVLFSFTFIFTHTAPSAALPLGVGRREPHMTGASQRALSEGRFSLALPTFLGERHTRDMAGRSCPVTTLGCVD